MATVVVVHDILRRVQAATPILSLFVFTGVSAGPCCYAGHLFIVQFWGQMVPLAIGLQMMSPNTRRMASTYFMQSELHYNVDTSFGRFACYPVVCPVAQQRSASTAAWIYFAGRVWEPYA